MTVPENPYVAPRAADAATFNHDGYPAYWRALRGLVAFILAVLTFVYLFGLGFVIYRVIETSGRSDARLVIVVVISAAFCMLMAASSAFGAICWIRRRDKVALGLTAIALFPWLITAAAIVSERL